MIRLDYFTEADIEQLLHWNQHTSPAFLLQWAGPTFTYPLTKEQVVTYIKDSNTPDATNRIYKVTELESEQVVGHICLGNIDRFQRSARIGKVLIGDSSLRGKGIGAAMIKEIIAIGFNQLDLHRISLGVFHFNKGALLCYQKVGFQVEGLLRDYRRIGDDYWSLYEMSMLKEEYVSHSS